MSELRILFLSDTHLGFDLPLRPRIQRRRRGPEFFANFRRALHDAVARKVDCVIHGGDLLYRSRVPPRLVEMVFKPLKEVAALGIPVFVVPGNHERSAIPHSQFSFHPNLYVFTRPQTYGVKLRGRSVAVSGFPFIRRNIRGRFKEIVEHTGWRQHDADVRLLCMHQSVGGASVGPSGFVFKWGADVVRARDIPNQFSAILAGHIHRHQVLTHDLKGVPMDTPVFYAGATDRVSFAERKEAKGYLLIKIPLESQKRSPTPGWKFYKLPSRPMAILNIEPGLMPQEAFRDMLRRALDNLPCDAIVNLQVAGPITSDQSEVLRAPSLRSMAGPSRNIQYRWADHFRVDLNRTH